MLGKAAGLLFPLDGLVSVPVVLPKVSLEGFVFVEGFTLPRSPLSVLDGRLTAEEFAGEVRLPLVKFASPLIAVLGASTVPLATLEGLGLYIFNSLPLISLLPDRSVLLTR